MKQKRGFYDIALFASTILATVIASIDFFINRYNRYYFPLTIIGLILIWLYLIFRKPILRYIDTLSVKGSYDKLRRILVFFLPVAIIGLVFYNLIVETGSGCVNEKNKVVIGIARFSDDPKNPSYSTRLIADLRRKVRVRNLRIKPLPNYINTEQDDEKLLDELNLQCEQQCINEGILTYGYWKETNNGDIYDCYVYLQESDSLINSFNYASRKLAEKKYEVSLPRYISFTSSAEIIDNYSDFINGIVLLYTGAIEEANLVFERKLNEELEACISEKSVAQFASLRSESVVTQNDPEYLASVLFYSATIKLLLDDKEEARERYRMASDLSSNLRSIKSYALKNYQMLDIINEEEQELKTKSLVGT
ncbi:MAG: hypothetical protein WBA74_27795, partial [Cyclobacteriaceae bacterium]